MRSKTREKIWSLTHGLTPPEAVAYCPISGPGVASVNSIWALCVNSVNSGRGMCIGGGWAISRQLIQGGAFDSLAPRERRKKNAGSTRPLCEWGRYFGKRAGRRDGNITRVGIVEPSACACTPIPSYSACAGVINR